MTRETKHELKMKFLDETKEVEAARRARAASSEIGLLSTWDAGLGKEWNAA